MKSRESNDVVLSGAALRAAVVLAEKPGSGEVVRRTLFRQLGIDELLELDLREVSVDVSPASLPVHHSASGEEFE